MRQDSVSNVWMDHLTMIDKTGMTMLTRLGIVLTLALLLQACGSSDNEAPKVDGRSAFTCDQINTEHARGNTQARTRMIQAAVDALEQSYVNDSPFEHFFRNHVLTDADYALRFHTRIRDTCLENSKLSANEAARTTLTSFYQEVQGNVRWAMCTTYNSGDFTFEQIHQEMLEPTGFVVGGDRRAELALAVINSDAHGADYFKGLLDSYCEANPYERLWVALGRAGEPAMSEIREQELAAEQARREERERERAEEVERRHERNLQLYSGSLVDDGPLSCNELEAQYRLARGDRDSDVFLAGLSSTLNDLASDLLSHEKDVFDAMIGRDGVQSVAIDALESCHPSTAINGMVPVILQRIRMISEATTEAEKYLLARIANVDRKVQSCTTASDCPTEGEVLASQQALTMAVNCDYELVSDPVCFSDPQQYFELAMIDVRIVELNEMIPNLNSIRTSEVRSADIWGAVEACKNDLLDQGIRGDEYHQKVETVCIPNASEQFIARAEANYDAVIEEIADLRRARAALVDQSN